MMMFLYFQDIVLYASQPIMQIMSAFKTVRVCGQSYILTQQSSLKWVKIFGLIGCFHVLYSMEHIISMHLPLPLQNSGIPVSGLHKTQLQEKFHDVKYGRPSFRSLCEWYHQEQVLIFSC